MDYSQENLQKSEEIDDLLKSKDTEEREKYEGVDKSEEKPIYELV